MTQEIARRPPPLTRMLRAIRFDNSDDHVFERAAPPDDWVVSGAVLFSGLDPSALAALKGKPRQAFANGFLGAQSCGWSTFATVGEATPADVEAVVGHLARHFVTDFDAPCDEAAREAARHEVEFVIDLVREAPINTVFTVRRSVAGSGDINEEFRTIKPPSGEPRHARIWAIAPDETDPSATGGGSSGNRDEHTTGQGGPDGKDGHS